MENEQNMDADIIKVLGDIASRKQYALGVREELYTPIVEQFVKEHSLDSAKNGKGMVIAQKGTVKELVSPERRSFMYKEYLSSDNVELQKSAAKMFEDIDTKSVAKACIEILEYRDQNHSEFADFNGGMGDSFKADIMISFLDFFMSPRDWPTT